MTADESERRRRGRPPKYVYGLDTLEDVRRALADVKLASPLKRGKLKKFMASEPGNPGNGRSQKWERRKKTKALLEAARNRPIYPD
jgi:hypothetical protein